MYTLLFKFVDIYGLKYVTWFVKENTTGYEHLGLLFPGKDRMVFDETGCFMYNGDFDLLQDEYPDKLKQFLKAHYNINESNIKIIIERLDKIKLY